MADDEYGIREQRQRPPSSSSAAPPPPPADGKPQVADGGGAAARTDISPKMLPMHPHLMPALIPQLQEQNDHGPGIYAVPYQPSMGYMTGFSPKTLTPLTYRIPTRRNTSGTTGEGQGQDGRQQQGPQRQVVVRRFQFAFQLDLALIVKLAAIVFLFSQEGSRHRLVVLVLFAAFIYLYQTGVLLPLIRWIRRGAEPRQPLPHLQPRPAIQPENGPPDIPQLIDPQPDTDENVAAGNQPAVNDDQPAAARRNGFNWWSIVKEIQTFVVGFVASLLPGYPQHE